MEERSSIATHSASAVTAEVLAEYHWRIYLGLIVSNSASQ